MVLYYIIFNCFAAIKFLIFIKNNFSLNEFIYSLKYSINNISCIIRIFKSVQNITKIKDGLIRLILLKSINRVIISNNLKMKILLNIKIISIIKSI